MSQINSGRPSLYNPATQTDAEIVANFVIRLEEFSDLFDELKKNKMEHPPQHYIIQAQRGYGKTTLLLRLRIEVESDPELNSWLIPVMFDEEQYGIFNLAKFWEEAISNLADSPDFYELSEQAEQLNDEEELFKLLIKTLVEKNKKLLLLVDNFGELLDKLSKKEVQRLREILITSPDIRLIGASSVMLEAFYNHKEPFYNFFKIISLDELSEKDTVALLRKLAETYSAKEVEDIINTQPQRIEALRRLAGGVPRTIILLFEIFVDDKNGNSIRDLEKILDHVTPLYKHRLDDLSKQQQVIIDAVAQAWDAVSTGEIARTTGMPAKAISAQLNLLEKNQLIKKIPTSTKNFLYQVNERFFNIYYLMRIGRKKNRKRVIWLARFFEMWCDDKMLEQRALRHIAALKENKLFDKHAFYFSQALASTPISPELQHELLSETRKYLELNKSNYCSELVKSHYDIYDNAEKEIADGNINNAIKILAEDGINIADFLNMMANIYIGEPKDIEKAREYYELAIGKGNVGAINNLAVLYKNEYKDKEKAKEYYELAIGKGHVGAINNLAVLYKNEYKDKEKAKKYYELAIEKGQVGAMNNLALLFINEYKDKIKAKEYFELAIDKGHVGAINNLAVLYKNEYKDKEKAKEYFELAIEKGHVRAIFNLAVLYKNEYKDKEKAKEYYELAIEKGNIEAMNNLALLFDYEYNNKEKAKEYYELAIEKGCSKAMFNYASLLLRENINKNKAQELISIAVSKDNSYIYNLLLIIILLWNNETDTAINKYKTLIFTEDDINKYISDLQEVILMFISEGQYNFVYSVFKENNANIRDRLKPVYYALLKLMGDEYNDEYLRMGDELKQTVEEIIAEISRLENKYFAVQ